MSVNVRIPGIGTVSAENAATENTLRQLVTAITQQQGRARRADSETAAASRHGEKEKTNLSLSMINYKCFIILSIPLSLFTNFGNIYGFIISRCVKFYG